MKIVNFIYLFILLEEDDEFRPYWYEFIPASYNGLWEVEPWKIEINLISLHIFSFKGRKYKKKNQLILITTYGYENRYYILIG
jgi:hypothetical protein